VISKTITWGVALRRRRKKDLMKEQLCQNEWCKEP
jgi:hypothetical protein